MPPVEFEPTISAGKRPQTYALDRAVGHWDQQVVYLAVRITVKCLYCIHNLQSGRGPRNAAWLDVSWRRVYYVFCVCVWILALIIQHEKLICHAILSSVTVWSYHVF
jgi:hypothetical protein